MFPKKAILKKTYEVFQNNVQFVLEAPIDQDIKNQFMVYFLLQHTKVLKVGYFSKGDDDAQKLQEHLKLCQKASSTTHYKIFQTIYNLKANKLFTNDVEQNLRLETFDL